MMDKFDISLIPAIIACIFWAYFCFFIPHQYMDLNGIEYAVAGLIFGAFFLGMQFDDIVIAFKKYFKPNKSGC